MPVQTDVKRMQRMKRTLAGAGRAGARARRAGSPFARRNLRTLFRSALGTFPTRRHRG